MGVTIRNWSDFPSSIGELAAQGLDLVQQGRTTLDGVIADLPTDFSPYPPASDDNTLFLKQKDGNNAVRLEGHFKNDAGRVDSMRYYENVVYDGGTPTSGEYYQLTGGNAKYDPATGFSGFFGTVDYTSYSGHYTASLRGKYTPDTGAGSFRSAAFRIDDGSGATLKGDIRFSNGDGSLFTGTVRGLDIYGAGGHRLATASGLRVDAADFGASGASFAEDVIFAGNDNVTLGDGGVYFKGWDGKDRIKGGSGNDTIDGGNGSDVLTGGAGNDSFLFSADATVGSTYSRDTITDFKAAADVLVFDTHVFATLANSAYHDPVSGDFLFDTAAAAGVLTYSKGVVYYDADGSAGAGVAVAIVKLAGNPHLANGNFATESFAAP